MLQQIDEKIKPFIENQLRNYEAMDSINKQYSVVVYSQVPNMETPMRHGIPTSGAHEIRKNVQHAIAFQPLKIMFYEYDKKNPQDLSKPSDIITITIKQPEPIQPPQTPGNNTPYGGLAGVVNGEMLPIPAMEERIKNLMEKLEEQKKLNDELETELVGYEKKLQENENKKHEVWERIASIGAPILQGFMAKGTAGVSGQLGEAPNNVVKSSVISADEPIGQINEYLQSLTEEEFQKVYSVIQYLSESPENIELISDLIKEKERTGI